MNFQAISGSAHCHNIPNRRKKLNRPWNFTRLLLCDKSSARAQDVLSLLLDVTVPASQQRLLADVVKAYLGPRLTQASRG